MIEIHQSDFGSHGKYLVRLCRHTQTLMSKAVWVPLRASEIVSDGEPGRAGWQEEFFGLGSVAISVAKRGKLKNWLART